MSSVGQGALPVILGLGVGAAQRRFNFLWRNRHVESKARQKEKLAMKEMLIIMCCFHVIDIYTTLTCTCCDSCVTPTCNGPGFADSKQRPTAERCSLG